MTDDETHTEMDRIRSMSHTEMARLYRFAPAGHIYFNTNLPFNAVFQQRFKALGGMTPAISKEIGL